MNQSEVKIGLFVLPPVVDECAMYDLAGETPSCPYPGLASRFLAMCLRYAGLNYTIAAASSKLGSHDPDSSSWTGLFGQLQRGQIDMIAMLASFSSSRAEHFAYTRFFSEVRYVFLIKTLDVRPSQGALLLLNGFSAQVWLALLTTLGAIMLSFVVVDWVKSDRRGDCCLKFASIFSDRFWETLCFALLQSKKGNRTKKRHHLPRNVLLICLSILTVITVSVYQKVVYDRITSSAKSPPFRSTEELVDLIGKGRLTLLTTSVDLIYFDYVNTSEHRHFKLVRRVLRKNPVQLANSTKAAVAMLQSERGYVFVTNRLQAMRLVANDCDIAVVDLDTPTFWAGFVVSKTRPELLTKLDESIVMVSARLEHLEKGVEARYTRKCSKVQVNPLPLGTLVGVFFGYGGAVGLAVVIGAAEKLLQGRRPCLSGPEA